MPSDNETISRHVVLPEIGLILYFFVTAFSMFHKTRLYFSFSSNCFPIQFMNENLINKVMEIFISQSLDINEIWLDAYSLDVAGSLIL